MIRVFNRLFVILGLVSTTLSAAAPTISSFTPTSGIVGTSVVITGTNFAGATAVKFNGVAASSYTVTSATKITAVAQNGVTTGKLSVTTSGGTATSSSNFKVSAPTITGFTPTTGIVGSSVVLTGTNFTGATAVKFSGVAASGYTVTGTTKITAVAPVGVTTGKLSVTTSGGTATSTSNFTVSAPTISSFTPTSGGAGTLVTLIGTNFTGATGVKFNGTPASSYTVAGATIITAVAPAGVSTGKISVTTAGGTASSSLSFTVVALPIISSFSVAKSPITGGASTTLIATFTGGTGNIDNAVGPVNSGSAKTVSPLEMTTYTLTVTGAGGTATRQATISVVAPPDQPVVIGPSRVTANQAGYAASVETQAGSTYGWTIANGTITAGGTTNQITFSPSSSIPVLKVPRAEHSATLLANGKVLLAGGTDSSYITQSSVELYSPATNTVALGTSSMRSPRAAHTATLLTTGKVLIVGGYDAAGNALASAEVYDPSSGAFALVSASMPVPRQYHSATALQNGKVIVIGGYDNDWNALASALLFDPSTNAFTAVSGVMATPRGEHSATLLSNGKVLVSGGYESEHLASMEVFEPASNRFTTLPVSMSVPRIQHSATLLANGKVMLAGGSVPAGVDLPDHPTGCVDVFDPVATTLTSNASSLSVPRSGHSATALSAGRILVTGGWTGTGFTATAEIYDPATGQINQIEGSQRHPGGYQSATLLPSGQVLLTGGYDAQNSWVPSSGMDLFDPYSSRFGGSFLSCVVTNSAGMASGPGALAFTLEVAPVQPVVSLPSPMFEGRSGYVATTQPQTNCSYVWSITNGTITSGNGTATVQFSAGISGTPVSLTCSVTNAANTTKSGNAAGVVNPGRVILTPTASTVVSGGTQTFTSNQPVYWSSLCMVLNASSTSATATAKDATGFPVSVGTYEILATSRLDPLQQATALLTVHTPGAPSIASFTVDSTTIHAGQAVTLRWDTSDAEWLLLDADTGDLHTPRYVVTGTSTITLHPSKPTTYKLIAGNAAFGQVWAVIRVQTDQVPTATDFSIFPKVIQEGQSVQAVSTFLNGTAQIRPGDIALENSVPITISPTGSTRFRAVVTNPWGACANSWDETVNVLGQGRFLSSTTLEQVQSFAKTTLLRDGRVLLVGGTNQSGSIAQLFDPISGTVHQVGSMTDGRSGGHTATLCSDGKVLVWGGGTLLDTVFTYSNTWEIFDPTTDTFTNRGFGAYVAYPNSVALRTGHSATLLTDGRVLIAGGASIRDGLTFSDWSGDNGLSLNTTLLVDLNSTGMQVQIGNPMGTSRYGHSAIRLLDGRILVAGGQNCVGVAGTHRYSLTDLTSAEIYDPTTGQWAPAGNLNFSSHARNPRLMADGRVMFAEAEVFDPITLTFALVPASDSGFDRFPSGVLLPDGRVFSGIPVRDASPLLHDTKMDRWFGVLGPYPTSTWSWRSSLVLLDGTVIAIGTTATGQSYPNEFIDDHIDRFDPQPRLSITPAQGHTNAGAVLPLQAIGPDGEGVTWSSTGGTIRIDGQFTATNPGLYAVTATAPSGLTATVWVDVHPAIQVTVAQGPLPQGAAWLRPGDSVTFSAKVLNTPDQTVVWRLIPDSSAASITSSGLFMATKAGAYTLRVTSAVDPARNFDFQIQVYPGDLQVPRVSSFTLSPTVIRGRNPVPVTFSWATENATWETLEFPGGQANLQGMASYTTSFTPSDLGTGFLNCTLMASNPAGRVSKTALLQVMPLVDLNIVPSAVTLYPGQQQRFGYTMLAPSQRVTWEASGGSLSPDGVFTAPAVPGQYIVKVTSMDDPGVSASASIAVLPCSLSLSPASSFVPVHGTKQLGFSFTGPVDAILSWTATGGNVTPGGLYSAPATPGIYTISINCSSLDLSASVTVTVGPISLSIAPTQVTLVPGQTQQFGWSVTGGGVTFSVLEPGGGNISQTGLYTPPVQAGVYTVQVVSQADPTKSVQAKVTINPIAIFIDPPVVTLEVNQSFRFGASLNNGGWTWATTGGEIDDQGYFRAPTLPGSFTVTVQSLLDQAKAATSQVTVVAASSLSLDPNEITINCGASVPMTITGLAEGASVTWTVRGSDGSVGGGTMGSGNIFTAGNIPGSYIVTAMESPSENRAYAQVRILSHRVYPEEGLVGLGQQLHFAAETFDGSPSMAWSVSEVEGGTIDAAGLYTAPLQQGLYHIIAQTSSGNPTSVPVMVGPPDGFIITPEINIFSAGRYEIKLRLKASNGRMTESLTSGDYSPGIVTPAIIFSQGQLRNDLSVDGPYTLEQVVLNQLVDGELLEVDQKNDLGVSGPYDVGEGNKPWISIGAIQGVSAEDSNGNGLIDTLKVQINVDVICDGAYSIGGGLVSSNGIEVGRYQADLMLKRGTNTIVLAFDGKRIHEAGMGGPYGLSCLTIVGPVTQSVDLPDVVTGYILSQFEH